MLALSRANTSHSTTVDRWRKKLYGAGAMVLLRPGQTFEKVVSVTIRPS